MTTRKQEILWGLGAVAGITVVIVVVMLLFRGCSVDKPKPQPAPPPAPLTQNPPPVTPPTDPQKWDDVEDLKTLEGHWEARKGQDAVGTKLLILQRPPKNDMGKAYRGVYPWSLIYEPQVAAKAPLRCGFYSDLQLAETGGGRWRLAYCAGYERDAGAGSYAQRLMFHVEHSDANILKMRVGNTLELMFDRAQEME